jgi:CO dehydrogenase maturation factor
MIDSSRNTAKPASSAAMPLRGMRLMVCGKGGSGKTSIVALLTAALQERGYEVIAIDGDASNPGGLARLLFGSREGPEALISFFGGREKVVCPVDDPAPLTRIGDASPVTKKRMELGEIPSRFFMRTGKALLFQVGKIARPCEGCDGPMSKVTRDFLVRGDQVTLIDVEAGLEHFGRGVEKNVEVVLVVVDPTSESLLIAEKVSRFCGEMGIDKVWAVMNNVGSEEIKSVMMQELEGRGARTLGLIRHDPKVFKAGLLGTALGECEALEDVKAIADQLERAVQPGAVPPALRVVPAA